MHVMCELLVSTFCLKRLTVPGSSGLRPLLLRVTAQTAPPAGTTDAPGDTGRWRWLRQARYLPARADPSAGAVTTPRYRLTREFLKANAIYRATEGKRRTTGICPSFSLSLVWWDSRGNQPVHQNPVHTYPYTSRKSNCSYSLSFVLKIGTRTFNCCL